ncbi:MAG: serine--tRNA ligase [Saprospirales bacterium]|nr:MAG: serine--tRNA ligase [Saprospirales bacterium]
MLELKKLKGHWKSAAKALEKRGMTEAQIEEYFHQLKNLDLRRRRNLQQAEEFRSEIKRLSKEVGKLFKTGKAKEDEGTELANEMREQVLHLKRKLSLKEANLEKIEDELRECLYNIPNLPHELVPAGDSEEDNYMYKDASSTLPDLGDNALPHWELAKKYKLFDFELGVKVTGSGFPVYTGKGAALQRAMITYFLNKAKEAGYREVIPPLLVNEDTARGTGQLPDKEGQMYHAEKDNFYLIPTAEVPITNLYRGDIIKETELPIRMVGYTPCFRREAGSYGAHVKGLNRVHQFDKVEIVQFARPENSYEQLDEMLAHVEGLLNALKLPYRILRLCGGDLGFTAALTYDFEVWSAAQERWLEVSSVSNFETYQSNRMMIRTRSKSEKPRLVHTLNGSALALPRVMAALLELYQDEKGIKVPEVLVPYTGFKRID